MPCDHGGHRITGFAHIVKAGHDAARQLWLGHQLDGDLGGHGQHAFAAHQHGQQVVAGGVQRIAAKFNGLAFNREALDLEHVVHRQPVLEAVHTARVFGHIAANGAGDLAGGVGGVIQVVGRGRLADGQVAHTGLDHRGAAERINLQNLVELGQAQGKAVGQGHGTARQAGARAPRHHRHPQVMAGFQDGLHLGLGFGQGDCQRALAVSGQAITFIGGDIFAVPEQRMFGQHCLQGLHQLGLALGTRQRAKARGGIRGIHGLILALAPYNSVLFVSGR